MNALNPEKFHGIIVQTQGFFILGLMVVFAEMDVRVDVTV